ncbi:MAG: YaiO family outer membrane beta-barrel protein [Hylemonella sp.]|nr:YaiO family outer membrane beta-barrel protein [Hylemonella sp.]MDH5707482.1 YaiO family outer membrane beta-barrel protein [Hylemonella sp.]
MLGVTVHPVRASAADDAPAVISTSVSTERHQLSRGGPDWSESVFQLQRTRGPRQVAELSLTQSSRFGLHDDQVGAQYSQALTEDLTASAQASSSSSHHFLPRHSLGALLQYEFAPAWLLHFGSTHRQYTDLRTVQATLMLERYVAAFSWALAWRPVRALGREAASTELRANYYYADRSFLGLSVSTGQEATQVTPSTVALIDVESIGFKGRHQLTQAWIFNYALSSTRQGDFHIRNGLLIGAQYLF